MGKRKINKYKTVIATKICGAFFLIIYFLYNYVNNSNDEYTSTNDAEYEFNK